MNKNKRIAELEDTKSIFLDTMNILNERNKMLSDELAAMKDWKKIAKFVNVGFATWHNCVSVTGTLQVVLFNQLVDMSRRLPVFQSEQLAKNNRWIRFMEALDPFDDEANLTGEAIIDLWFKAAHEIWLVVQYTEDGDIS
jgi:hypothetical protein